MADRLQVRFDENIAFIEFTHGKNEFTHEFLDDLNGALDEVLRNPSAEVLVTYGTGKHYSNGLDLTTIAASGMHASLTFSKKFCEFMARMVTFPMPTVAAINGHAFAGGCVLALCHDYRVMSAERGWMCLPEVKIRLMFTRTLMEIMKDKIPTGPVQRDMLSMGKRLTGPEAVDAGIVDRTAPHTQVLACAADFAKDLVKNGAFGREAMLDMKNDLYSSVVDTLGDNKFNFLNAQTFRSKV